MPPMDAAMPDMGQDAAMDAPPMDGEGAPEGEQVFDTNFDAGVDANEDEDPKKYIQQLTGKLSETLRRYNSEQPQTDKELNKYVAGMIVKQCIEGLSEKDANEILNKVKGEPGEGDDAEAEPQGDMEGADDAGQDVIAESKDRKKMIDEIFNDVIKGEEEAPQEKVSDTGFRTSPYRAKNFK